jgi:hypothetical protein
MRGASIDGACSYLSSVKLVLAPGISSLKPLRRRWSLNRCLPTRRNTRYAYFFQRSNPTRLNAQAGHCPQP